jgi:hypothetical protein
MTQIGERRGDGRERRQFGGGAVEHFDAAIQLRQALQGLPERCGHLGARRDQARNILGLEQGEQRPFGFPRQPGRLGQGAEDADVAEIDPAHRHLDRLQRARQQTNHREIGGDPGMAIEFGADLHRLAAGGNGRRHGVQHAAAIAQARDSAMVEQMGVDARRLRRDVGTHPHGAPGKLVDQLEGTQIEILAGAGQQRLEVFEHRRHDEFEAVTAEMIEHRSGAGARCDRPRPAGRRRCIRATASS